MNYCTGPCSYLVDSHNNAALMDLCAGLADPYVKGHLGPYRFQTKIHKKTLNPKWMEEFKIPVTSWAALNLLSLQVRDKDPIFDDTLGLVSLIPSMEPAFNGPIST